MIALSQNIELFISTSRSLISCTKILFLEQSESSAPTISLPQLSDETKVRILALIKELGQNNISSPQNDNLSTVKLAFVDKNLYICSTCSGPVQWV
jgi:hypothetical protein